MESFDEWMVLNEGLASWVADRWASFEGRYGRKQAIYMALAMAATSWLPFNIAAIIAAAEAIRKVRSKLTPEEIDMIKQQIEDRAA